MIKFDFNGEYVVYQDMRWEQARIHKRSCRFIAQHGGVSRNYPPNTWYVGPFLSVEQAQWYLDAYVPEWNHGACSYCGTGEEIRRARG